MRYVGGEGGKRKRENLYFLEFGSLAGSLIYFFRFGYRGRHSRVLWLKSVESVRCV